jgi:hypothetical protein
MAPVLGPLGFVIAFGVDIVAVDLPEHAEKSGGLAIRRLLIAACCGTEADHLIVEHT